MSYFQATDGTTLYYRDHGDGPPVVLLASQGLSGSMWQHLMVRLAGRGLRCVAPDRRGHGRSDDPGKGYDFDRFADDVSELLTLLDLRDVTLPSLARTEDNPDGVPLAVMQSVWEEWHGDWPRWVGENAPHGLVATHLSQVEADIVEFANAQVAV